LIEKKAQPRIPEIIKSAADDTQPLPEPKSTLAFMIESTYLNKAQEM
jgi:hypothetical protein